MFRLIQYRCNVLKELKPFTRGIQRFFVVNVILSSVFIAADFIVPLFYKLFIEQTIIAGHFQTFYFVAGGYLSIHFLVIALRFVNNYNTNRIQNHVSFGVKNKIWRNLFQEDFEQYEHQSIGDIKMRMEDDTKTLSLFSNYYTIEYLIHSATMTVCIIMLFLIEWRLALFSIVCIPFTFSIDRKLSKKEMMLNDEQRKNDESLNTWLYSSLQGWKEIKALNLQHKQKLIFTQYIKKYAIYYAKWINYWTLRVLIIPKIRNEFCMKFGLYFLGGLLIIKGNMTIGNLLVFAIYFDLLSSSMRSVSEIDSDLQSKKPYIDRLLKVIKQEYPKEMGKELDKINSVELKQIHYHYPNRDETLRGVNLSLREGERVAIIGKSGCGKTTLLKVLVGMLQPSNGDVLYSNVNLNQLKLSSIHKKIGFVMQNSSLYNMSIKENLFLGNPNASCEELIKACEKACILDYIQELPKGFDTIVGEHGSKLSGGQRQRIVLARAFLRDVDIFIFDEATSALDQLSEKTINDAIANIGKDKIILIVAHRESTISLCDRVIPLDCMEKLETELL